MAALRLFFLAVALTAPVWALQAIPAHACSCGFASTNDLVARTNLIVLGRVSDLRLVEPISTAAPPDQIGSAVPVLWTVSVEEYIKGSGEDVFTGRSNTHAYLDENGDVHFSTGLAPTCAYAPEPDLRHLLFLTRSEDGVYSAPGCSGSVADVAENQDYLIGLLEEVRAVLASPTAETEPTITSLGDVGTGGDASGPEAFLWVVALVAGAGVSLTCVGIVMRRLRWSQ